MKAPSTAATLQSLTSILITAMPQSLEASARAHIRRESLDIYNRLRSIEHDISFVNQVRAAYPTLPLIRTALPCILISYVFPSDEFCR